MSKHNAIFLILFLVFAITGGSFAQETKSAYEINWSNETEFIYLENDSLEVLTFEEALHPANNEYLPIYIISIPLPMLNMSADVEMNNISSSKKSFESTNFSGKNSIQSEYTIKSTRVVSRKKGFLRIEICPIRTSGNGFELLDGFDLEIDFTILHSREGKGKVWATSSVLGSGSWYSVSTIKKGIHQITGQELQDAGINIQGINPKNIRIYGFPGGMLSERNSDFQPDDLYEMAIVVEGENDGVFNANDRILFYAESIDKWDYNSTSQTFNHLKHLYAKKKSYFINWDVGNGKRINLIPASTQSETHAVSTFNDYQFHERDSINIIKSGREWYGEYFNVVNDHDFSFSLPNIDASSDVILKSSVAARSNSSSSFTVEANGNIMTQGIQKIPGSYISAQAMTNNQSLFFKTASSIINIEYTYNNNGVSSAEAWLNYIEINARRNLKFDQDQLFFQDIESVGIGNTSKYSIESSNSNVKIWDVTSFMDVKEIPTTQSGNTYTFKQDTDSLRHFVAHDGSSYFTVEIEGAVDNQNLHAKGNIDFVIFTHPDYKDEAIRLADFHQTNDQLNTLIVEPQQVYNEFSGGEPDIGALRNFMRMLYDKAQDNSELPQYLLLLGDGSYDNLDRFADNTNFILTFQSRQSLTPASSYVTDDFYGLLDENEGFESYGNLDIGIGRIPVYTKDQAKAMIDKFMDYVKGPQLESNTSCSSISQNGNYGDWRNIITFIGDDEDGNLHIYQANQLAKKIEQNHKWLNVDKIYTDAYQQQTTPGGQRYPDVNNAINERMSRGALVVNYTGHGGELGWGLERFLLLEDIHSWSNYSTLPVYVTATCEFSRFDDPGRVSAGEYVYLNEKGGAVAMFTTTRLAFSGSNFNLNNGLYNSLFKKTKGEYPRLGDVIVDAKISAGSDPANKNFVLLGNPAMSLAYPKYNVRTELINGQDASTFSDTLKALEYVEIEGTITDQLNTVLSNFNGVVYPTIFDKALQMSTLGQDATSSPFPFKLQKSVIYKGKSEVIDGRFKFSFIIPKDIAYNFDFGKISYYALSDQDDATGYFEDFIVGGTANNFTPDNEGPKIRLFINDSSFVDGGITHEHPILFAIIEDEHGINTTGNGIGHDIVAFLDHSTDQIVLNDYFESEINSYQKGYVVFPLSELSPGKHHISLKAWDIYNNSGTASIEFFVEPSGNITLQNVIASPNPLVDYTSFWLEHNQACNQVEIVIDIYDLAGRHVASLNEELTPSGFKIGPVEWDGRGYGGENLSGGMYIYRVLLRPDEGKTAYGSGKLNIIR